LVRNRAQHQVRLPAGPLLGLDPQNAAMMLDVAVDPAKHVSLQRRQHGLAVALEDERARLVQPIDRRLAQSATEGPSDEPLQLDAPRGSRGQELDDPRVGLVGANPNPLEVTGLQKSGAAKRKRLGDGPPPISRLPLDRLG
jgi:hypothetical protein